MIKKYIYSLHLNFRRCCLRSSRAHVLCVHSARSVAGRLAENPIVSSIVHYIMAITFCLLLSACGFQLRGQVALPPVMKQLTIVTPMPYSPFTKILLDTFGQNNIDASVTLRPTPVTLVINSEIFSSEPTTVSADTRVRQITLTYILDYSLRAQKGEIIIPSNKITITRYYTSLVDQALGAKNTEMYLLEEMRHDLATQLMYRLQSRATRQALENYSF